MLYAALCWWSCPQIVTQCKQCLVRKYQNADLEYGTMRCHIKHGKTKTENRFFIILCNIGTKNGFRFDYNGVLNMFTVQRRLPNQTLHTITSQWKNKFAHKFFRPISSLEVGHTSSHSFVCLYFSWNVTHFHLKTVI